MAITKHAVPVAASTCTELQSAKLAVELPSGERWQSLVKWAAAGSGVVCWQSWWSVGTHAHGELQLSA